MDSVMIPLVWPTSEVEWALEQLRKRQRAGLVRHNTDDTYTLFFLSDLAHARADGQRRMEQVRGGHPVLLLDASNSATLDLVRPSRTRLQWEQILANSGLRYALAGESPDMVMIVTGHETDSKDLSTGGYQCTGTPTHYFPEPRVSDGDLCPMIPECSGPGGTRPTIKPY
jgi:hypothetical protein